MKRRDFIKLAGSSAVIATSGTAVEARQSHPASPDAIGMLYDSTLCVGCQACVVKCKEVNHMAPNPEGEAQWEMNSQLSPYALNVIRRYDSGDGSVKDREQDGFAYIKRQCMHCVDPNCVSVCPVSAMTKDPVTGIVSNDPDICTGCRYCMVACPYNVPKYEYHDPFGQIQKCELCNQPGVERISNGLLPGCVEVCPTGAIIFGKRDELLAEAKRRLAMNAGDTYNYPRETLTAGREHEKAIPEYFPKVYGEHEGGGTQVLVLAGLPHEKLGLPDLPDQSYGARSETIQHTLYQGMILPFAALMGLTYLTRKNMFQADDAAEDDKDNRQNSHQNKHQNKHQNDKGNGGHHE
ncbi:hydrogenase 2 operon protein HybA [Reinekea marinisedimentorum]|uniref:Fe-S-cluster-containing dehydrogenase component n=1 Tax=Reinekea marinisedimentorum TaxID=230495 RepID=A0A4R3HU57_9GAMM|nr:hydrogenase 2 operon protein HybA [Reinekea marinisedimentorum]TCS36746.1 Fe-S-cluster-containing dehydrogenase component [Reinekea marinisedimentorum]